MESSTLVPVLRAPELKRLLKERMYVSVFGVAVTMLERFYNFFEKLKVEKPRVYLETVYLFDGYV